MDVPFVRVSREQGETTRRELAEADLIDDAYEIDVEGKISTSPSSTPTP